MQDDWKTEMAGAVLAFRMVLSQLIANRLITDPAPRFAADAAHKGIVRQMRTHVPTPTAEMEDVVNRAEVHLALLFEQIQQLLPAAGADQPRPN